MSSAEIYDPVRGRWSRTGSLLTAREEHAVALLGDGRVLAIGGCKELVGPLASTEVYNPATGTWISAGNLRDARWWASATTLLDGRVLVVRGVGISLATSPAEGLCWSRNL